MAKWLSYDKIYYNPSHPASYGSAHSLKRSLHKKASKADVQNWLRGQESYTLHKNVTYKFPRRRVIVGGMNDQWQADLIDMSAYSKQNKDVKFLLTVIDVFSKFAWVIPLKSKFGKEVAEAFNGILSPKHKPMTIQTDKGKEFLNGKVQDLFKHYGIKHFTSENADTKASVCERLNRSIQRKIHRHMSKTHTRAYVNVLPQLVKSYNSAYHRSIGMAPKHVTHKNSEIVWQNLFPYDKTLWTIGKNNRLRVGDFVRISKARKTFQKGYLGQWSKEIFKVSRVHKTSPHTFSLVDLNDEIISGNFYAQELQKVQPPDHHDIERILDKRVRRGKIEYLVRWSGYSKSFDSWVPASQLVQH